MDIINLRAYKIALQKADTFKRLGGRVDVAHLIADNLSRWDRLTSQQREREWQTYLGIMRKPNSESKHPLGS